MTASTVPCLAVDEDGFTVESAWLSRPSRWANEGEFLGHGLVLVSDPDTQAAVLTEAEFWEDQDPAQAHWDKPGMLDGIYWTEPADTLH